MNLGRTPSPILPAPIVLLTVVSLVAIELGGCQRGAASAPNQDTGGAMAPSRYATIASGKVDVEGGVVEVAARHPGVVREVLVQEGDTVRKGQILARLEDREARLAAATARAAVAQARSQLALAEVALRTARREQERLTRLAPSGPVSRQQLDQAADNVTSAEAQLAAQRTAVVTSQAQLAQAVYGADLTLIRAPLDGRIIRRYANPGAGASTLNVSDMFDLEPAAPHIVRAEIVESALPDVHVGQAAEIISEADPTQVARGRVLRIAGAFGQRKLKSDAGNEATDERVVEVVVSADNTPFLIGQRVLVKFMKAPAQAGLGRAGAAPPLAQWQDALQRR
ncbi:MAG: efflux RND transporter periplasmic adaptor subunit [Gammaproteobacteria bacterium]|nr:MAG: efflux RND transporter periplasmic adaptor subunit [Gammaproteobacteria bacterium]